MLEKELYLARDKDNSLCAYDQEPMRNKQSGFWTTINGHFVVVNEMENLVPELRDIKWSDEMPVKVKLSMEGKK